MFYLSNLSSQAISQGVAPWDFKPESPIPEEVRKNKKKRNEWINDPQTKHYVYSFNEGTNSNLRISRPRTDGGGNPIVATHALVADYDSPQPKERVLEWARSLPFVPNWLERTLSGNWRFVWLLEEKLQHPSFEFARHFFKSFPDFAFDPSRGSVGFDKKAWEAPERLWTNSCEWVKVSDVVIPADVSRGWMVKASGTFKWTEREFGPAVPLDVLKPELLKRYPGFASWPGEFTVNAQGPTFWVVESQSPKSAIVRETGIQTFSANTPKAFTRGPTSSGLISSKSMRPPQLAVLSREYITTENPFWHTTPGGVWISRDLTAISRHLRTARRVSPKSDKEGVSRIDRAVEHIETMQRVTAATAYVFQPAGILIKNNKQVLNTSNIRVLQPADGKAEWGEGGQFPWVSKMFELYPGEGYDVVRAWLAWGYRCAYNLKPESGQVLFVAGPEGVGKTMMHRAVFGVLFGGIADPTAYFAGDDNFNSELFEAGLWSQDDGTVSASPHKMRFYAAMLKKIAANGEHRCNGKYQRATLAEWKGRVCISCNADAESMMALPDTGISNLDKLLLVRTSDKAPCEFPSQFEITKILKIELPWLARWLLDWEIPKKLLGGSRFGIKAYANPTLLETSRHSSRGAGFKEILDDWKCTYFTKVQPAAKEWTGTGTDLLKALYLDAQNEQLLRHYTPDAIGRILIDLVQKDLGIALSSKNGARIFTIQRGKL